MPTAAEPTAPDDRVTVTGTTMPGDTTPVGTTAVPGDTVAPSQPTTTAPFVGLARTNVLLLGGDAGPGRFGLRSDAMIVVSIDPASGDTAMISLPRNLRRLPFPAGTPLADRFPRGFNDLANAVYPFAENNPELVWGAVDAGAQAMKLGAAQLLGMPIQYYVLVDMAGFVDVVDALGGIDITVGQRVPSPGNPPGAKHDVPEFFEPGHQHMDGTNALAYARSRSADSDYQRMARQRCVLGAIADAATPVAVASGLGDLVSAFGSSVRTDIPRDDLPAIAELVERYRDGGALASVRTLQLTPPLVNPNRWDLVEVRALVASVVEPNGPPAATPPDPSIDPPTTPSAPPSETSPPLVTAPTRILADAC
jgi:LCP family protein required for cell wall assembly